MEFKSRTLAGFVLKEGGIMQYGKTSNRTGSPLRLDRSQSV